MASQPFSHERSLSDGTIDIPQGAEGIAEPQPSSIPDENRRDQNAIFDAWLASEAGKQALASRPRKHARDSTEIIHSLGDLSAQLQNGAQIIRSPRDYQIELFERAKQRNTIAVLDTGSGKTLIAILLLRWTIENELESRSLGRPHKIAFFLVPAVNLVFQQHSVLERNLDFKISRLCGADGIDTWKDDVWKILFSTHHAVVCTAEILHICLSQGFINIEKINLIVFDEAHHCKGNHPYAKILRDFYHAERDRTKRPHVFGMTASPVDGKGDVVEKATELEILLDSHIVTTSTMSLTGIVKKPHESYACHARLLSTASQSHLLEAFSGRFGNVDIFAKSFRNALEVGRTLGNWFAETYLLGMLSDEQHASYEIDIQKRYSSPNISQDAQAREDALTKVSEAIDWARNHSQSALISSDVAPKVMALKNLLAYHFGSKTSYRCIVFVRQRSTAHLLHAYFQANKTADTENLVTGSLTGVRWAELDELRLTHRKQMLTLMQFRNGDINCLFATQVAEEGLDVADCNLIIRFDLCTTMIQYVQSRGRARNQDSHLIHMIEEGNAEHRHRTIEAKAHEAAMKRFCEALPADRYLQSAYIAVPGLRDGSTLPHYLEPLTSAKLSFGNAVGLLANFVSSVPSDELRPQHPEYVIERNALGFVARVLLPKNCPISSAVGHSYPRQMLAKQSAAFEACVKLRSENYIDEHLRSTYKKELPAMRNAHLAINPDTKHQYFNRVKPAIWSEARGTWPAELWMTVIEFRQASNHPLRPLILLTRGRLPQFPDFPVYPDDGHERIVVATLIDSPLTVTSIEVDMLGAFTLRVFRDVFSKTFENDSSKLSYWICPHSDTGCDSDPKSSIDWSLLHEVYENDEYRWSPGAPDELLTNKFIFDPYHGGRKFYSKSINKCLRPSDPIPDDVVKIRQCTNILDYSNSLWKNSRQKVQWSADQPVMEAVQLPMRRNLLAPPQSDETSQAARAVLCPEPLRISVLPPDVVATLVLFPAIIHRFESCLISIEGCRVAGIDCELGLGLAAFTKDSDNSGDWRAVERINFQHGMGENYERLEFIGDTFLKLTTSLATFIGSPSANEFESHVQRMLMLCNKNLLRVALDLKLYEYIRCTSFSRRLWYPEGIALLAGKGSKKDDGTGVGDFYHEVQKRPLGDKTIADVSEALIGAAFITHDRPGQWDRQQWDQATRTVTKLVDNDGHRMLVWTDYSKAYQKPTYQTAPPTAVQRYLAQQIYEQEGYLFTSPRLLYSAFAHPSLNTIAEGVPSYQRLEFLGDALLDVAANSFLFHRHPSADPQWLTEHKMAITSNRFLGALCVLINFHTHLRHMNPSLQSAVASYAAEIRHARSVAPSNSRDFWLSVTREPPKCLPDIVEAYIAAIFIDADFDFGPVQAFFDRHMCWFFEDMAIYDSFANSHPVRRLEMLLRGEYRCVEWRVMAKEVRAEKAGGDDNDRGCGNREEGREMVDVAAVLVHGRVIAANKGKSARYARARAAEMAASLLEGVSRDEFRGRFGCSCPDGKGKGPEKGVEEDEGEDGVVGSQVDDGIEGFGGDGE